jgi:hypothetical protein
MDLDKMMSFIEIFDELNEQEKKFIIANLNHIVERFNDKFNKNITVKF